MWNIGEFPGPPGSSPDDPSAPSAGASFSVGPPVGSDNYVRKPPAPRGWVRAAKGLYSLGNWFSETVRAPVAQVVDNAGMASLQRGETTTGPLAHEGRTITLVARTTTVHLGSDERGALHVYARPAHVEVLEEDGQRHVVRVPNIERTLVVAIVLGAAASIYGLRYSRRTSSRIRRSHR